jgi:hypothetical protein
LGLGNQAILNGNDRKFLFFLFLTCSFLAFNKEEICFLWFLEAPAVPDSRQQSCNFAALSFFQLFAAITRLKTGLVPFSPNFNWVMKRYLNLNS